jgi:hypothetical protein
MELRLRLRLKEWLAGAVSGRENLRAHRHHLQHAAAAEDLSYVELLGATALFRSCLSA